MYNEKRLRKDRTKIYIYYYHYDITLELYNLRFCKITLQIYSFIIS